MTYFVSTGITQNLNSINLVADYGNMCQTLEGNLK